MDEVCGTGCKELPNHVAIIMDGNGRWALKRHLPAAAGHRAGAKKVREISEACVEQGIKNLTLFAFSTENWQRPDKEVGGLMDLMRYVMKTDIEDLRKKGVRLSIVGEREAFDTDIVDLMEKCEESTAHNEKLNLSVAVNFGGRWDIVQACRKAIEAGAEWPSPDEPDPWLEVLAARWQQAEQIERLEKLLSSANSHLQTLAASTPPPPTALR